MEATGKFVGTSSTGSVSSSPSNGTGFMATTIRKRTALFGIGKRGRAAREKWGASRQRLAGVVESKAFEVAMGVFIVLYAVLVVIETDARAEGPEEVPFWLVNCMRAMLSIYFLDSALRLYVYRNAFFRNPWNTFDLAVVLADGLAEFLSAFGLSVGMSVSVLRVLRLGRLIRFFRMLSFFQELYTMFLLMMSALRAISWGALLMAMMLTIWSMVAVEFLHPLNQIIAETTDAYEGCDRCPRAFESVLQSNLTFFQQIIAGDGWGRVSVVMIEHFPGSAVLLISVIVSVNLGLMNLIITVIVDKAQTAREENVQEQVDEKNRLIKKARSQFVRVCELLDEDGSGSISFEELAEGFDAVPAFADAVQLMDFRRKDMRVLFNILDTDEDGFVSYDEFSHELTRMRLSGQPMVMEVTKAYVTEVRNMLIHQQHDLTQRLEALEQHIQEMWEAPGSDCQGSDAPSVKSTARSNRPKHANVSAVAGANRGHSEQRPPTTLCFPTLNEGCSVSTASSYWRTSKMSMQSDYGRECMTDILVAARREDAWASQNQQQAEETLDLTARTQQLPHWQPPPSQQPLSHLGQSTPESTEPADLRPKLPSKWSQAGGPTST